ncbi:MAG: DUF4139 domain-containing protein [Bacteroidetes bacterium]|nr:DUF4139 domain-containing protein [Bacteroidota bacterium]
MKKIFVFVVVLALAPALFALNQINDAKVTKVKVFLRGAEITHSASIDYNLGQNEIILKGLSTNPDMNSLRITGEGDFIIMESKKQTDYLGDRSHTGRIKVLEDSLKLLRYENESLNADITVAQVQMELIMVNNKLGTNTKAPSVLELQKMQSYFASELTSLNGKVLELRRSISKREEIIEKIKNQLDDLQGLQTIPLSELVLKIIGKSKGKGRIEITYFTQNAGWNAAYDLRVKDINSSINLTQKGRVWQNTGLDWNNLSIVLSTGNPSLGSSIPDLYPWYLDFMEERTDIYGMKKMQRGGANEMVAMSLAKPAMEADDASDYIEVQEGQISKEFVSELKYDIPSDGKPHFVQLQEYEIPATYKYFAAPKISNSVFLAAHLDSWSETVLLPGKINIFFENTYVGNTQLNLNQTKDIKIALGRDEEIAINREQVKDFTEDKFLSKDVERKYVFKIDIRNNKKSTIELKLEDQIPVSQHEDIEIEILDLSGGQLDKDTGKITWQLNVKPNQSLEKAFSFSVRYPGDKEIMGL